MATGDLCVLGDVKKWLPLDVDTDDSILSRLITATSEDALRAMRRPDLLAADYLEARQGDGSSRITTYHWPINTVATLKIGGVTIAASADKIAAGYFFDLDIDPERVWNLYLNNYVFTDGAAVQLSYNAGYAAVPGDIAQAVIDWVAQRYKARPNVAMTRRRDEGETADTPMIDAPETTKAVIERYMRCVPSVSRRYDHEQREVQKAGIIRAKGTGNIK
jgi:hypothetical protein